MIALDTNVLVRVFINDNESPEQCRLARELVKKSNYIFISQNVQVELVWLLRQGYDFDKVSILQVLDNLWQSEFYILENKDIFQQALTLYRSQNADFSDYMILSTAQKNHSQLWTFDKKLSKTDAVNLLNQDNLNHSF